jgi:hypothetical protein
MVFALKDARRQLSEDVGDYFVSTTTGAGTTLTVVDTRLSEEDNDDFVTKPSTVSIVGAQAGGPASDEERRIAEDGLTASTLTVRRAFSVMASGIEYEVNRLFTAAEKDRAIAKSLELCVPIVWKHVLATLTVVEDQHTYDIAASGFYRNVVNQANLVGAGDDENEYPIFGIEYRDGTDIYFHHIPEADREIRLRGIGTAAVTNLDQGELLIVTARAAMYLASQAKRQGPVDRRTFYEEMERDMTNAFAERVQRFMKPAPAKNYITEAYDTPLTDTNWRLS